MSQQDHPAVDPELRRLVEKYRDDDQIDHIAIHESCLQCHELMIRGGRLPLELRTYLRFDTDAYLHGQSGYVWISVKDHAYRDD